MCDSKGVLNKKRTNLNPQKQEFATDRDINTLAEAMVGADVFLGLSVKDVVTPEMVQSMAPNPIVFALANPDPQIEYSKAMASRPDIIFATGRSDYPNQINNVLVFPGLFRGALDVRASDINTEMMIAAARAIASSVSEDELSTDKILPYAWEKNAHAKVAAAVAKAAKATGVARK